MSNTFLIGYTLKGPARDKDRESARKCLATLGAVQHLDTTWVLVHPYTVQQVDSLLCSQNWIHSGDSLLVWQCYDNSHAVGHNLMSQSQAASR